MYCGGMQGDPQIDILTDNLECPNGASQESLDDLSKVAAEMFNFIKDIVNTTGKKIGATS